MFRWRDGALFFAAPAGDGDDSGDGSGDTGGGAGGKPRSEIDELRSAKDREIQAARDETNQLKGRLDALERQNKGDVVVATVQAEMEKIDVTDPKAMEKLSDLTLRVAHAYSRQQQSADQDRVFAHEQAANYRAAQLVQENGGDFATYKAELVKGESLEKMDLIKDRLELRLQKEGKPRDPSGRFVADSGSGGAQRTGVGAEMAEIDVTTPEGRKQWEAKRAQFRKALTTT